MTRSPKVAPFVLVNLETGDEMPGHFAGIGRCTPDYCGYSQHNRTDPKYVIAQVIE